MKICTCLPQSYMTEWNICGIIGLENRENERAAADFIHAGADSQNGLGPLWDFTKGSGRIVQEI